MGEADMFVVHGLRKPAARSTNGDNKLPGGSVALLGGLLCRRRQTQLDTGGADLADGGVTLAAYQVMGRHHAHLVQRGTARCEASRLPSVRVPC